MKKFVLLLLVFGFLFTAPIISYAQKSYKPKTIKVKGYTTKKGKYVKSHYRSKPSKRKAAKRKTSYVIPILVSDDKRAA